MISLMENDKGARAPETRPTRPKDYFALLDAYGFRKFTETLSAIIKVIDTDGPRVFECDQREWNRLRGELSPRVVGGWLRRFTFVIGRDDAVGPGYMLINVAGRDPLAQAVLDEAATWVENVAGEDQK